MQLRAVHLEHPYYGVARFAIELNWTEKKARRIRNLAGITAAKRTRKGHKKAGVAEVAAPANALRSYADFKDVSRPRDGQSYARMVESGAWVQDFTYIWFERAWHYLAVVLDLKTRQIVGWRLGLNHTSELTYQALLDALSKHPVPTVLHSDQGSEYLSYMHQLLCQKLEVTLSCSANLALGKMASWNDYLAHSRKSFRHLTNSKT